MMLVKCPCCKGAKALMGPGFMSKPCQECKGKGEVKATPKQISVDEELKKALSALKDTPVEFKSEQLLADKAVKLIKEAAAESEEVTKVRKVVPIKQKNQRGKK